VIAIVLPSLRERKEDIPLLAYHFLKKYSARVGTDVQRITPEAMRVLQSQSWPGNVRELENAIEHAVVFCRDKNLTPADLPFSRSLSPSVGAEPKTAVKLGEGLLDLPYREAKQRALAVFEESYFSALLERTGGNISEAARQAGLDRSNFRRAARRAGTVARDDD
jgi:DNA-binding NtrC family response regulator